MNSKRHQRLRLATGMASALWAAGREDLDGDQRPARPGDVFVAATGGDLMIEWLVVDTDAAAKRLRIAPADDDGHAGSLDVELDRARHGGLACVRCALACWVGDPAFDPRRRTGRLDDATLLRVRSRLAAIENRSSGPPSRRRAIDDDPDYRRRMEQIAAVRDVAFGAGFDRA
ncbi:MAG: hypothetical protein V3T72_16035 [Thermoanaerobaculia bacterium]